MDKKEGIPLARGNTDLQHSENVAERLFQLEAFIFKRLDKNREFLSVEVEDVSGKPETISISEAEAFLTLFGGRDCEEMEETVKVMVETVKNTVLRKAEALRSAKAHDELESKRVAEYKAAEAIKAKELEALKAEGAKKRRAAYEIEHAEELRKIAQKEQEKEEYGQALKSAKEDGEDSYIGGSGMKKLKSLD
jgi:hypothetical protein